MFFAEQKKILKIISKMKKLFFSLISLSIIFISCSSGHENTPEDTNLRGIDELIGDITSDRTLNANTAYTLKGEVFVNSGAILTIPAGTVIKAYAEAYAERVAFLAVKQGGKIIAEGTPENPIKFTSSKENPAPGDWGGLVICGKAITNLGKNVQAEVTGLRYGGTNSADNSGVYSHIIVEYSGALINPEAEFNGVTFYAVGSGTIVDNIIVRQGSDDAFEWFGGSVNVTNLAAIGCQDDSFDWTEGWNGTAINLYSDQSSATAFSSDSRGIEADNNSTNPLLAPISNPTLKNITLIGRDNPLVTSEAGIMLRRGTNATIDNVYISGFKGTTKSYGINFDGKETQNAFAQNPITNISINNSTMESNHTTYYTLKADATGAGNRELKPTWMSWMD